MSKIVVITGSPRKSGNSFAMTDAFINAAEEKGHSVVRFDAAFKKVAGCRACDTCYSTGKACSFDDDFNAIAPEILKADGVVFTMPVYWYTMPAQIKSVLDRMYSFIIGQKPIAGKKCALIACCADEEDESLHGVQFAYKMSTELMGWESVGEVLIKGVSGAGEIAKTDGCKRAAALAEQF